MPRSVVGGVLALAMLAGSAGHAGAQETCTPIFSAP